MNGVAYDAGPPPWAYRCARCSAYPCKLWRQSNTLADCVELLCVDCACADRGQDASLVREDGKSPWQAIAGAAVEYIDQIDYLVPAVPTPDGETYWGFSSVPDAGVAWWRALPLRAIQIRVKPERIDVAQLRELLARQAQLGRHARRAEPVRVVAAAIRYPDPLGAVHFVPRPGRHHDVIASLADGGFPTPIRGDQGFVLSDGSFADRARAWEVAQAAGQLLERAPTDGRGGALYSEDVW